MRLWSLHPKYLDSKGLVALWREALLAQAVLRGEKRGYRYHPQLERFKRHARPRAALAWYLQAVHMEAERRGYSFDKRKIKAPGKRITLWVTTGQLEYEWSHLLKKLRVRAPTLYRRWKTAGRPDAHPLFRRRRGAMESWERP